MSQYCVYTDTADVEWMSAIAKHENYNMSAVNVSQKRNCYCVSNVQVSDVDVSAVSSDESQSVIIADATTRWHAAQTVHCRWSVQHTVVTWVHRNIIVLDTTAWVESLSQWGRVVVVVRWSAVECDDCCSQRPTRDIHCPVISDKETWRQWMFSVDNQWRLLHSPTHTHKHTHTHTHTHTSTL